jgi:probable F420-dependent oxidoreductase
VAFARSPFTLAQSAWDLAQLSEGNFLLGLGSQVKAHVTRRFSMPWDRPVGQMREMVGALRAIWDAFQTGGPLRFEGHHYRHTLLTPNFNPGPGRYPEIPIGLAAVGPQMTSLAGEVADAVIFHPFTHPDFLRSCSLPLLLRGLERANRERKNLSIVGTVFAFVEDEHTQRRESAVRDKIGFYGSTPAYREVLETLGRGELGAELHALSRRGDWAGMGERIDDRLLNAFRLRARSREQLFQAVRERYDGLYDRVVLTVPGE